jgi:hypothetical protein
MLRELAELRVQGCGDANQERRCGIHARDDIRVISEVKVDRSTIRRVPTIDARLSRLEAELIHVRDDLEDAIRLLNGGGEIDYARSVRGRLHRIEADLQALLMLRRASLRLVSRGWRFVAGFCLIAATAAPYVVLLLSR